MEMSQFRGIDVCLRMFTVVEVLDGENMVGCRMCWKIANEVDVKGNELRDGANTLLRCPLHPYPNVHVRVHGDVLQASEHECAG